MPLDPDEKKRRRKQRRDARKKKKQQSPTTAAASSSPAVVNPPVSISHSLSNHTCTKGVCQHLCGELGGTTKNGSPCTRKGAWGISGPDVWVGMLRPCKNHDTSLYNVDVMDNDGLTARQKKFVVSYCDVQSPSFGNAHKSADVSGFHPGHAAQLMEKPQVVAAIRKLWAAHVMLPDEVLVRQSEVARFDASELILAARGKKLVDVPEELFKKYGRFIREVDFKADTIKFHDSMAAQVTLARIHKMFRDAPQVYNNYFFDLRGMSDGEILERMADRVSVASRSPVEIVQHHSTPNQNGQTTKRLQSGNGKKK